MEIRFQKFNIHPKKSKLGKQNRTYSRQRHCIHFNVFCFSIHSVLNYYVYSVTQFSLPAYNVVLIFQSNYENNKLWVFIQFSMNIKPSADWFIPERYLSGYNIQFPLLITQRCNAHDVWCLPPNSTLNDNSLNYRRNRSLCTWFLLCIHRHGSSRVVI